MNASMPDLFLRPALGESDGILNFMTDDEIAAVQPFLEAYERVRSDEGWGGDDLDLPFHAKRHRDIWNIRQRTFRVFESLAANVERGIAVAESVADDYLPPEANEGQEIGAALYDSRRSYLEQLAAYKAFQGKLQVEVEG